MYTSIVVGPDGSGTATAAVDQAARMARCLEAHLHVAAAHKAHGSVLIVKTC